MIDLLFICLIVALVYNSGFWTSLDEFVNKRFRFHHIPHILTCALCQTWWLSLLYIIVTGHFTIMWIALCLVNAHLVNIMIPLAKVIENWLMKIIEWIMPN